MTISTRSPREAIESRGRTGKRAFVPFLTAGFPSWELMDRAVELLRDEGADCLELGVPFSDPLADGPTIQDSSAHAIARGVSLTEILQKVAARGRDWGMPVVLMSYANPIIAYGVDRFARDARAAGVGGLLVSDLPPEELPDLWRSTREANLETVLLVAPTSTAERIKVLAGSATGYVYCVTRTGVTGRGGAYASNLGAQVEQVRAATKVPIVAGFGVREPADVKKLGAPVDGVIVGARLIELLREGAFTEIQSLARGLRSALDVPRES